MTSLRLPQDIRLWLIAAVATAALLIGLGWLLLIGPQLSDASSLRSQTDDAALSNEVLSTKVDSLRAQSKRLPALGKTLKERLEQLPISDELPAFTVATNQHAAATGVTVSNLDFGSVAPALTNASSDAATASSNPAGQLFSVPVTITTTGSLAAQRQFLADLQDRGPRVVLVSATQITPLSISKVDSIDAKSSMTTTATVFVAPQSPAAEVALKKQLSAAQH